MTTTAAFDRINFEPGKDGRPRVHPRDLRITVSTVVGLVAEGEPAV